ncbi:heme transporter HemC [Candidatus Paracaedimonas acanthamoebae]|nr:heme transporter HemC [Candidatus Paracaedimonas acanthamoebae]
MRVIASPKQFLSFKKRFLPWCVAGHVVILSLGLWFAFLGSPPDYQMGEAVRIMYIHVPASWFAMGVYALMALHAIIGLITKHPLADIVVKAAAPIGALFTFISLTTGALWGKPMWGTWWVWDARLTSVLILFLLYLGYLALVDSFENYAQGLKSGSVLVIVGAFNLPIIKWSVNWWNTLHQPASLTKLSAPSIHPEMLVPLLLMAGAYASYFIIMLLLKIEIEYLRRREQNLYILKAQAIRPK